MALAVSMELPPPMPTRQSARSATGAADHAAIPAATVWVVGSGTHSEKTECGMPASESAAVIGSSIPLCAMNGSVTIIGRLRPNCASAAGNASRQPPPILSSCGSSTDASVVLIARDDGRTRWRSRCAAVARLGLAACMCK